MIAPDIYHNYITVEPCAALYSNLKGDSIGDSIIWTLKAEIIACGVRQTRLLASTKKAQKAHLKTLPKEWEEARGDTKSQILEKKVADLTKLVEQLLKEKENG